MSEMSGKCQIQRLAEKRSPDVVSDSLLRGESEADEFRKMLIWKDGCRQSN